MNIVKSGITLVITFLITGVSHHFTECLIEHVFDVNITLEELFEMRFSLFNEIMKYEMEIFNYFDAYYDKCQAEYRGNPFEYDATYWKQIHSDILHHERMTQFTEILKSELTCLVKMEQDADIQKEPHSLSIPWVVQFLALDYSLVFLEGYYVQKPNPQSEMFLRLAVYLAAFGANPETAILLRKKIDVPLFLVREENGSLIEEHIDYGDFVKKIRNIIFPHYDHVNKKLDIDLTEVAESIQQLNQLSRKLNSLLTSTLFGETPSTPGKTRVKNFKVQYLWDKVIHSAEIIQLLDSISASLQGRSSEDRPLEGSGGSTLIAILREIEKLILRIDYPASERITDNIIDEVVQGFKYGLTLGVHVVQQSDLNDYIIFTKDLDSDNDSRTLADRTTLSEFLERIPPRNP